VERVSVSSSGRQANGASRAVAVTPSGRYVLFNSVATNLVVGDTNQRRDVFLRDRKARKTVRVSVGPRGRQANARSTGVAVSADGRFVLFTSRASNLTRIPDRNHEADIFVRDRARGATFRVSVRPGGGQFFPGRFGGFQVGGISDDGRWVAFGYSVPSHPTGCCMAERMFIRDRLVHRTRRLPVVSGFGFDAPVSLSADGTWLTFQQQDEHFQTNVTSLTNLRTGRTINIPNSPSFMAVASRDAHYVAFNSLFQDGSGVDAYRWNRVTGTVAALTPRSLAINVIGGLSSDGRVGIVSGDPGLVAGDTNAHPDAFRIALNPRSVERVDLTAMDHQIAGGVRLRDFVSSSSGFLTGDGKTVVFTSRSGNIVAGDTNRAGDVFVRGPIP